MRRLTPASIALIAALGGAVACGGESGGTTAWTTQVDSTGDTVRVHIAGAIPSSEVRTLVPEMEIGVEDGSEEETFGWVVSLVPMKNGSILVYDDQAAAIRLFDSAGTFVRNVGHKGGGPGEFGQINGIARRADGSVVVWDASGGRINAYSDTGGYLMTWRVPMTGHFGQRMLWADEQGHTLSWVVMKPDPTDFTRGTKGVIRYDERGTVLDSVAYPVWREPPPSLIARSPDGRGSSAFTFPFAPSNVAVPSPVGGFVSGPGAPYVLYLTGRDGVKPTRVEVAFAPVPVSPTERREYRAFVEYGLRRTDPNWSWTVADIPEHKPSYEIIQVGLDGRIWVSVSMPGIPIPESERAPVKPGTENEPRFTTRDTTVMDVFSPSGRLLGRVGVPRRLTVYAMEGDRVYAVRSDTSGVEYVGRYRVTPAFPK